MGNSQEGTCWKVYFQDKLPRVQLLDLHSQTLCGGVGCIFSSHLQTIYLFLLFERPDRSAFFCLLVDPAGLYKEATKTVKMKFSDKSEQSHEDANAFLVSVIANFYFLRERGNQTHSLSSIW